VAGGGWKGRGSVNGNKEHNGWFKACNSPWIAKHMPLLPLPWPARWWGYCCGGLQQVSCFVCDLRAGTGHHHARESTRRGRGSERCCRALRWQGQRGCLMVVVMVVVMMMVMVMVVVAASTCQRPVHRLRPHRFNSRMLATPKRHTGTQTTARIHPDDATD
jgi:hypothetical protein